MRRIGMLERIGRLAIVALALCLSTAAPAARGRQVEIGPRSPEPPAAPLPAAPQMPIPSPAPKSPRLKRKPKLRPAPPRLPATKTVRLSGGVTIEMVLVPAGSFTMGSKAGGSDEGPAH